MPIHIPYPTPDDDDAPDYNCPKCAAAEVALDLAEGLMEFSRNLGRNLAPALKVETGEAAIDAGNSRIHAAAIRVHYALTDAALALTALANAVAETPELRENGDVKSARELGAAPFPPPDSGASDCPQCAFLEQSDFLADNAGRIAGYIRDGLLPTLKHEPDADYADALHNRRIWQDGKKAANAWSRAANATRAMAKTVRAEPC